MPRLCRVLAIALCALLLQACSAVQFASQQAPTALLWQADNHLDLNSRQEARLKADLAAFLAWHRKTQLPVYAEVLAKTRPQLTRDLSAAQSCSAWSEAKAQLQPTLAQRARAVAAVKGYGDDLVGLALASSG